MIDIKQLEKVDGKYFEDYKKSLISRNTDPTVLEELFCLNKKRKESILKTEEAKSELNFVSQEIGKLKKQIHSTKESLDRISLENTIQNKIQNMQILSNQIKELEVTSSIDDSHFQQFLLTLPNKLHSSVPIGSSCDQNICIKVVGEIPKYSFKVLSHDEIGEKLQILDFERASKVTGSRFSFLLGLGAKLERALIQLMMDTHSNKFLYKEMIPPFMAHTKSLVGTGQLPKFKEDLFHIEGSEYYLIPTAEVPVTNYFSDEILNEVELPISFVSYSPCFRSEAGSYGRDTKGLIRQHQFNKVELVSFCHPEKSYEIHEKLTSHAEEILNILELPYRRVLLCSGDMGFAAAKTYDLEVWLPSQNTYREISSCSNFEDFQARRANIRFRPTNTIAVNGSGSSSNKPQFVHTLNGSGLAVGRTLVAIMENYQNEDGNFKIPKALSKYLSMS